MRSRWVGVVVVVAGCQEVEAAPLTGAAPYALEVTPLLRGDLLELRVDGLPAGARVSFVVGRETGPGPCLPSGLACLDVVGGLASLGVVDADPAGAAVLVRVVPATLPGDAFWFQAVIRDGAGAATTPPVLRVVDDHDLDGSAAGVDCDDGDPGVVPTVVDGVPLCDGCPPGTARIADTCVDRWEANLEAWTGSDWVPHSPYRALVGERVRAAVPAAGRVPQAYVSGTEAAAACAEAGKRLCTSDEWLLACRGDVGSTWPYGSTYVSGACNDHYAGTHPVVDYFGTAVGVFDDVHLNDPGIDKQPGTLSRGGAFDACVTPTGLYDLHGNVNEWVDDPAGTYRGGSFADGSINGAGCGYVTTAHPVEYHDYLTGFRCCVDAAP